MGRRRHADPSLDPLVDSLSRYERRFVVEFLDERGGSAPADDVEAGLLDRDRTSDDFRSPVATALRDRHLPMLEDAGVLEVAGDTVTLRDEASVAILDALREHGDAEDGPEDAAVTRAEYAPDQDRTLTDAIIAALREHRGADFRRTDFQMYEDLDFEALDRLFRDDADPSTRIAVTSGELTVDLWGDDGVQIRIADASGP